MTFNGLDKLILGQPSSFDGVIDDFITAGDTVVLKGFAESATSLLYTQTGADSCSLTLTNGDAFGGHQLRRRGLHAERFLARAVVRRRGLGDQVRLTRLRDSAVRGLFAAVATEQGIIPVSRYLG